MRRTGHPPNPTSTGNVMPVLCHVSLAHKGTALKAAVWCAGVLDVEISLLGLLMCSWAIITEGQTSKPVQQVGKWSPTKCSNVLMINQKKRNIHQRPSVHDSPHPLGFLPNPDKVERRAPMLEKCKISIYFASRGPPWLDHRGLRWNPSNSSNEFNSKMQMCLKCLDLAPWRREPLTNLLTLGIAGRFTAVLHCHLPNLPGDSQNFQTFKRSARPVQRLT